ncbi:hypothetical protein N7495_006496 [Penicillium taxi]|uniref:uncharacterized protein n=1 Tax=Penicillium taxi TaxID=168475 RepID=UPI002545499B|nr:uncharacterized protein N7495_006496 [Penicillium taxi]KAJ5894805.1 hypothetical protein N7495_006496 [Penicillium taxi]
MGGPYESPAASLGGRPSMPADIIACAIFIAIFAAIGAGHMSIFQINLARGHKFIASGASFGFCFSRVIANILRETWACYPTNARIAIAAQIFVNAGVLIIMIINLIFAQRVLRAAFPRIGWTRAVSTAFKAMYGLVIISIIMLITCIIQSAYSLNANTHRIDRDIEIYGMTYFLVIAFLPLPIVLTVLFSGRGAKAEQFGTGSWKVKTGIILAVSVLLTLGAGWRTGTAMMPTTLATNPPWYFHKACFYVFNFGMDGSAVGLYLFGRADKRFHVPDGSSQRRTYDMVEEKMEEKDFV